jgi:hypothetical protein
MAKVKCKLCANEVEKICKIKKIGVKVNKKRQCEAYVYDELKAKAITDARKKVPSTRLGYTKQQELKAERKAQIKALKEALKTKPGEGTAKNLGLIKPGDPGFSVPSGDLKHPLTGDLSRFTTTANKDGE